jgi:hypothetical protein
MTGEDIGSPKGGRGTVLGQFAYSRSTWSDLSKCQNFSKLLLLLPEYIYIYIKKIK